MSTAPSPNRIARRRDIAFVPYHCEDAEQLTKQCAHRETGMTDPTIICPNCKMEIRLTESLAAPLIAATRQQYEQQLLQKDEEVAKREQSIREKEKQVLA